MSNGGGSRFGVSRSLTRRRHAAAGMRQPASDAPPTPHRVSLRGFERSHPQLVCVLIREMGSEATCVKHSNRKRPRGHARGEISGEKAKNRRCHLPTPPLTIEALSKA